MHEAMAYDAAMTYSDGSADPYSIHATWCNIEVDPRWTMADDHALTCLTCLTGADG